MDTLFISDLHLSPDRPHMLELFRRLLEGPARRARALYILGDLFEQFWVGNDDRTPPNSAILETLRVFAASGVPLRVLRGNRDLLLDKGFEPLSAAELLPDHAVIDLDGARVLVMHGDLLCTRDTKYQRFRAFMEIPLVRGLFKALPYRLRTLLAHGLRPAFRRSAEFKPPEIIDVEQSAVEQTLRAHGVTELVHGHTHRPAVHDFTLDGTPAKRYVLGDWYADPVMLVCRDGQKRLWRVVDYLEAG